MMPKLYACALVEFPSTHLNDKGEPDMENGKPDSRAGTVYQPGEEVPEDMPGVEELLEWGSVSHERYDPNDPEQVKALDTWRKNKLAPRIKEWHKDEERRIAEEARNAAAN